MVELTGTREAGTSVWINGVETVTAGDSAWSVQPSLAPGANAFEIWLKDLAGRLASVADPSGLVEYSYDDNGNLEMETRTVNGIVFVTGYSYDNAGNLRSITYPTGQTIDYQPDAADPSRIGAVVLNPSGSNQSLVSAIAYKPFGPVAAMTLGNGIAVTENYDKNYQILSISAGAILDRSYTPDNVGNIQMITNNLDATRSQSFTCDDLYRLTNATGVFGTVGFTYDKAGNRLTRTRTGAASAQDNYAYYPGTNRLKAVTGDHAEFLQYDADGNITQRIPGAANPQPPVTDPADYTYNSAGQRAIKDAASDVVYHYDISGQLIAETDATGNMLVDNNLWFAGQYYDNETGLHYNYHRYYDPKLGRYLKPDPSLSFNPEGTSIPYYFTTTYSLPESLYLYAYAYNNPIRYRDPKGLFICKAKCKLGLFMDIHYCNTEWHIDYQGCIEGQGGILVTRECIEQAENRNKKCRRNAEIVYKDCMAHCKCPK